MTKMRQEMGIKRKQRYAAKVSRSGIKLRMDFSDFHVIKNIDASGY